ncbi:MAG: succinylglutamate desuccinylase/aspartoacylase family protein [Candidatus Nanohaloarchaea archaeon]
MKTEKRGKGEPEFTVIGSIHGDEPAGKKAIEKILKEGLNFKKPVKFIVANEEALEKDQRFLDTDLNRSFPGDRGSDSHEERLAADILEEVGDSKVLDLHTTRSFDRPFAGTKSFEYPEMEMIEASGAEYAVKFEEGSETLTDFVTGIVVETGLQQSDQAIENAVKVIKNFLAYFGVIEEEFEAVDPEKFVQKEKVEGDYEFLAENFSQVEKGQVYARRKGEELVAEESFYPVLMSTNGYEGVLGHKAERVE